MNKIEKWINKNIDTNLNNKNVVITGSNSGIGFEAALYFASFGANVYMAIRNLERGQAAKDKILEKFPNAKVELLELDIASFDSINKFADNLKKVNVDMFFNNAGVFRIKGKKTAQNIEITMGTNYIGTYYLNEKILPYLESLNHEVRIIFTGSIASYIGKLNYNDFFYEKKPNKLIKIYANSKLAISSYYVSLSRRYEHSNIKILLFHPGITYTPLINKAYKNKLFSFLARTFMKLAFHEPKVAALGLLYLTINSIENATYIGPRGLFNISGFPKKNHLTKKAYRDNDKLIEFTNHLLTNL